MNKRLLKKASLAATLAFFTACGGGSGEDSREFVLRITNVSTPNTILTSDGGSTATPLSPGVFVVHTAPAPFFNNNTVDRGEGLEEIAEDGDPALLFENLNARLGTEFEDVQLFNTPVGASEPGPIFPGESYEIVFSAIPGDRANFATMFIQSNDLFFGPNGMGIELFDEEGNPVSGDFTAQSPIWDAGTEVNQEIGLGPDQPTRQSGPDTGVLDPNNLVRLIPNLEGGLANLPPDNQVIQVTITPQ